MMFQELVQTLEGLGQAAVPLLAQFFDENGLGDVPLLLGVLPKKQSLKAIEKELAVDPALIAQSLPHVGDRLETLALLADVPFMDLKIRAGRFKPPVPPRVVFEALAQHWQVPFHDAVGRYYDFPFQPIPDVSEEAAPPYEWDWPGLRVQMGHGKAIGTDGRDWTAALKPHCDFDGHVEAMVVEEGVAKADVKKRLAQGKAAPQIIVHRVFAGDVPAPFTHAQAMDAVDFTQAPPGVSAIIAKGAGWARIHQLARRVTLAVTGFEQRGKALTLSLSVDQGGALVPLAKAVVDGADAKAVLAHAKTHGVTRHGPLRAFDPLGALPSVLCRATALQPAPRRKAGYWLGDVQVIAQTQSGADRLESVIGQFS